MNTIKSLAGACVFIAVLAFIAATCDHAAAQVALSSVAVTAQTASSATVSWTSSGPATSQVIYSLVPTNLNSYTPLQSALVTSHTATLTGLMTPPLAPYTVIYYVAQSVDAGGHITTSSIQQFELCSGNGYTSTSGNVSPYYAFGSYTVTWLNNSGQSISPTVCGQPIATTYTGSLDFSGSFNLSLPDNLQVVPSPSQWQITTAQQGGIGAFTPSSVTIFGPSWNFSSMLQSGAVGYGIFVEYDQTAHAFFPPLPGTGTVSSVGLSAPTGFGITNTPITSSGTIVLSMPSGWTTGDLLVGAGTNAVARLPVGTSGQCLIVSGGTWAPGTCGSGTITGATTGGGLIATGSTLGLVLTCSTNQVLQWNGTVWACATISGGSGITGLTTGVIPTATSSTTIGNSSPQLDIGLTIAGTLTYNGPIAAKGTTGVAGAVQPIGGVTEPPLAANSFAYGAPLSSSFTSFGWNPPAGENSSAGIVHVGVAGAVFPHWSQLTVSGIAIPDLTATGSPSNTTYLRGDNTWSVPPGSGGVTGTGTAGNLMGWATSSTAGNAPCTYTSTASGCVSGTGTGINSWGLLNTGAGNTAGNYSFHAIDTSVNTIEMVPAGSTNAVHPSGVNIFFPGTSLTLNPSSGIPDVIFAAGGFITAAATITAPIFKLSPTTFSTGGACSSIIQGRIIFITDGTVNTWGSVVSGGGANAVLIVCDGANWTVIGK